MKALKITLATLLMVVAVDAADHDERRVPLDEATIKSLKYGAEATLSMKDDGSLILKILMDGKPVIIPERALAPIKKASVGTAFFSTETPTGVQVEESMLKGGLILSFQYGDSIEHGGPKNPVDVRAGCRIMISAAGSFESIETAVPQGEWSNQWRVISQSKDGIDVSRETVESSTCPMRWIERTR